MNLELFSFEKAFKKCSGSRGEWHPECNKDYPDRMVPVSEFGMDSSSKDGLHHRCLKCDRMRVASEPQHPSTNEWKRNWKHRIAKQLGGTQGTPGWKDNLDEAERRWNVDMKNHLLDTDSGERVIDFTRKPPKFNQGKYKSPLARAVAKSKIKTDPDVSREGPGVVYVYEDEMKIPGVLKIGSTKYSKGRLPSANTWGAFNCPYERHFEKRFEAEDIVHTMLGDYRIWSDKEWFRVSLEQAIKAIEGVELDDTKEQALG